MEPLFILICLLGSIAIAIIAWFIGRTANYLKSHNDAGEASSSTVSGYEESLAWSEETDREPMGRMADKNGFEYACYLVRDPEGQKRMAYCRIIPMTYAFTCPDCGGMVVGVDAKRVWPGTAGPEPTAFRCEECGRQEDHDFGIPRVEEHESDPTFEEPKGLQPVCPCGGKHEWEVVDTWSQEELPEGVDGCLENLSLVQEVWYEKQRCSKCGEERVESHT